MPVALVGAGISAGISAYSAHKKANAAKQAAATQVASGDKALGVEQQQYGDAQSRLNPYLQTGQQALSSFFSDPNKTSFFDQPQETYNPGSFNAPSFADAQNDPGYQFALKQGEGALRNFQAKSGNLLSGAGAKALIDYNQGAAAKQYGDVYSRALQGFQANTQAGLGAFQANQGARQQQFSDLFNVANLGYGGAQSLNGLGAQYAGNYGNLVTGQGNATAAGTIGSSNAWGEGLSGIGDAVNNGLGAYYGMKNPGSANPYITGGGGYKYMGGKAPNMSDISQIGG